MAKDHYYLSAFVLDKCAQMSSVKFWYC